MVVTSQHNGAYLATAHHLIETQRNFHTPLGILIEDACLRTYHQIVFLGIAYPVIIIQILSAAGRVDTLHGGTVCLYQIFMPATEANPAERPVAVIKKFRSHNVFHVAGEDEAVFVTAVARYIGNTGIEDGFHKGIAIIEEVRTPAHEFLDGKEMTF